ncbi:uncharacterized protein [Zea mays]|jgi:hypothetical protein|uniref:Uncharacterized protein n=1 Tax=Zea mays TaxID=4577 RepID=B6T4N1_MAIZE|nr:uncharacterized protein LOC100276090 isoform 1 [Zea mays]XP_035818081.1 uncharacterized protein LOC100276090 isoform X2 [Zea mays]ACG32064.1 hypothetical protein [Zea mays]|eukprot:NP_001143438.1 uncharacterized protein LOC100276090 isoform 1 [Zea mays]
MGESPPLSDFDKKLMLQVQDKIYALREANNDLRDRLDESNERVVVQEAEIARLRMQLEKITSDRQTENDFSCSVCCNLVFAHALVSTWGCGRQ